MSEIRRLVVVLCGPHTSNDVFSPRPHRLDGGIRAARLGGLPLLYVGDGWSGEDVRHHVGLAQDAGVVTVGAYYLDVLTLESDPTDGRGCTLFDVRTILTLLAGKEEFAQVDTLILTTDGWHMERLATYIEGEKQMFLPTGRNLTLVPNAVEGHVPTPEQLQGERKGIADYLARRAYDPVRGSWEGKRTPIINERRGLN